MPETQPQSAQSGSTHSVRLGAVTFAELVHGLSWPLLLRALALAVQPARVALGFAAVLVLSGIAWVFDRTLSVFGGTPIAAEFLSEAWWGPQASAEALMRLDLERAAVDLFQNTFGAAGRLFEDHPFGAIVLFALFAPVWAIAGGAISRLVAVDVAGHLNLKARQGLGFAVPRVLSLVGSLALPLVVAVALVVLLKVAGWILLSLSGVNVVGSLLYGGNIALGLVLAVVVIGYALGHVSLVPSVAVDGADAMDAVQRAYAYVLGRPGRTLAYLAVALVQGLVVLAIAKWLIGTGLSAAESMSSSWISAEKARRLFDPSEPVRPAAAAMIDVWRSAARALLAGFAVSLYFTSSTLVYLLLRRACDEQDIHEVWMPGLIEGSPAVSAGASRNGAGAGLDLTDSRVGDDA